MKLLGLLFSLLLAPLALARSETANVLVLLQPARASAIEADDYHKGWWVRWPVAVQGRDNRLWSLLSQLDWVGAPGAYSFKPKSAGVWTYLRHRQLPGGFFNMNVGLDKPPVVLANESVSPFALFLGLRYGTADVTVSPLNGPWKTKDLAVGDARNWNDVVAISKKTSGRVLVVEYPPPDSVRWSRLWHLGPWPKGEQPVDSLRVPGLIEAKKVGLLLLEPSRINWTAQQERENPARWMKAVRDPGMWLLGMWGALTAIVFVAAARFVTAERRSVWLGSLMEIVLLSPAAALASGAVARSIGLETLPIMFPILAFLLWVVSAGFRWGIARWIPGAHPLWALSMVGLACSLSFDPAWSIWSAAFSPHPEPFSPEAFACFMGYLLGVNVLGPHLLWFRWVLHLSLLIVPAYAPESVFAVLFFQAFFVSLAAWLVAEGRVRIWSLLLLAGLSAFWWAVGGGFCVAPMGLLQHFLDKTGTNLFVYLWFVASPVLIATVCLAGALTLFGDRFFVYRMRRVVKEDPRRLDLLKLSLCTFAIGLFQPWILFVSLYLLLGGLGLLLRDGVVEDEGHPLDRPSSNRWRPE